MFNLTINKTEVNMNLNECLLELEAKGLPKLIKLDTGWHCYIKMRVTASGVDFEVKSDYRMASPDEAARQCVSRVREALKSFS